MVYQVVVAIGGIKGTYSGTPRRRTPLPGICPDWHNHVISVLMLTGPRTGGKRGWPRYRRRYLG